MEKNVKIRGDENERMSSEIIDDIRLENIAYEYLCRLEEARLWIQSCIGEDLPSGMDFEEKLRNGVYLAKLGYHISPETVPFKKIFDPNHEHYNDRGLQFRHTDNINYWLNALEYIGFPTYVLPDAFDVYDKRNMPKVIYCLHALNMYLHKLGRAPQIQDLSGKVHFTSEEINAVQKEFEKYGIKMPSFSTIGGVLATEMAVDDAVQHACILAINEAIDKQEMAHILEALQDHNAGLHDVIKSHIQWYQNFLFDAKKKKLKNAQNKYHEKINYTPDVYDELLTRAEIQSCICQANERVVLEKVNCSIKTKDTFALQTVLATFTSEVEINNVNMNIYMKFLSEARDRKFVTVHPGPLNKYEILSAIQSANNEVCKEMLIEKSLNMLNDALETRNIKLMIEALKSFPEQMDIYEFAAELYFDEFTAVRTENNSAFTYKEVCGGVKTLSALAVVNKELEKMKPDKTFQALSNNVAHIGGLNSAFQEHYHAALNQRKIEKIKNGLSAFLNHYEIQECIDVVNKKSLHHTAVRRINEAIVEGNSKALWDALSYPEASILCVDSDQSELYFTLLSTQQRTKAISDGKTDLNRDEIQDIINQANKITIEANHACLMIAIINNALEDNRSDTLMATLQTMNINNLTIIPQCYQAYITKLKYRKDNKEAQCHKLQKDDVDVSWVVHSIHDKLLYYYNLKTLESNWTLPKSYSTISKYLHQDDIINIITTVNSEYHKELQTVLEPLIIRLQSCARGYLLRSAFAKRISYFNENINHIIKIQAWWKSKICRKEHLCKKQLFNNNVETIVKLQSYTRMWLSRKKYLEKITLHAIHEQAAKKIQVFWRAYKIRKDFKILLHSSNPTLPVVQKFVHLLNISDDDYKEELELQKIRNDIVKTIRYNQKLEKEADDMDLKIGMLIKNRITLQEVISQRKNMRSKKKDAAQMWDISWLGNGKGLKSFSKESRVKLEAYQHLFYTLQTEPSYLAKLLFLTPIGHASRFVESTILTLYNYGSTPREEYLLLKVLRKALEEEIQVRMDNILDVITGNPLVIKMIIGFNRNGQGQIFLRELLGPLIKNVTEDKMLHINTNPIEVYKFWINEIETQTGQMSSCPYIVTQNEALEHEEVKNRLNKSIEDLKEKTLLFFNVIINSLDKIPYSMLYMSKVLKNSLTVKFPNVAEKEILKIVGNLLYYRYINSAIAAPDAFGIIDIGPNDMLKTEQRRNLASIAKVLQFAASGKGFGSDSSHLVCLNPFLRKCHEKFKEFFRKASSIVEPEIHFKMDAYSEAALLTHPIVYFTIQELCDIHTLLVEYKNELAPKSTDQLHMLLEDLGAPSTVQTLMGEDIETSSINLSRIGQTEICLTLSNKFLLTDSDSSDIDKLYTRTKQMIIDLLQYKKPTDTLLNLLKITPNSQEDLLSVTKAKDAFTSNPLAKSDLPVNKYSSQEHLQNELLRNMFALELAGYVSKKDGYQAILDDIGKDIKNRHYYRQCRKEELMKLAKSQKKLDAKTRFCEEKLECYNQYIKKCLDNLSSGSKKLRIKHLVNRSEKQDVYCKICLKYSGAKLQEKGVLMEIADLDVSEMKNVAFEISPTEEGGIFYVKAKFMGIPVEKVEVDIQDLLQLQYEGVTVMNMFDRAKINVNLLLYLLNSKFYGKGI